MIDNQGSVRGRLMRGGTSKGFFIMRSDLPDANPAALEDLILEIFGSPDASQIDGIGGSFSSTSKVMIVNQSKRDGIDVDYTFGQVGITEPTVDWSGNCGNLTSAVGTFAILEGIITTEENHAEISLYNTNTDSHVEQSIPLNKHAPTPYGDYSIDGVPGTGARIDSKFNDPAGSVFDSLTPTGNLSDNIMIDGTNYEVSIIDSTNPCVFVNSDELGLDGTELPHDLTARHEVLGTLEKIRQSVCKELGLVDDSKEAYLKYPTTPFISFVSPPQTYTDSSGRRVDAAEIDITARIITSKTFHHAYAMTGAMCLASAVKTRGTIPNALSRKTMDSVTIGHPKGTIDVGINMSVDGIESVTVGRTVRELFSGSVKYRYSENLRDYRDF